MAVLLSWRMLFAFLETLLPWAPVRNLTLFVPLLFVTQSWMIALTLHFHDRRAREAKSQGVAK